MLAVNLEIIPAFLVLRLLLLDLLSNIKRPICRKIKKESYFMGIDFKIDREI
jgi:hypothetical protein